MNKIIKFRAINTYFSDSKMVYFDLENAGDYIRMKENSKPNERWEIMQSTGLFDRNGEEIYEADIIRMYIFSDKPIPVEIKTSVSYHEGGFIVMKMNEELMSLRDAIISSNATKQGIEIIGNIFENPA